MDLGLLSALALAVTLHWLGLYSVLPDVCGLLTFIWSLAMLVLAARDSDKLHWIGAGEIAQW